MLTWTSEEGLLLFKEEVVEYVVLWRRPPLASAERPLASRYLVLAKYMGVYGLTKRSF